MIRDDRRIAASENTPHAPEARRNNPRHPPAGVAGRRELPEIMSSGKG